MDFMKNIYIERLDLKLIINNMNMYEHKPSTS